MVSGEWSSCVPQRCQGNCAAVHRVLLAGRVGWALSVLEVRCVSQEPKPGAGMGCGKELGSRGHISCLTEEETRMPRFPVTSEMSPGYFTWPYKLWASSIRPISLPSLRSEFVF